MHYRLYFPAPDEKGRTMLDYYGSRSALDVAQDRTYEMVYEGTFDRAPRAWDLNVLDALWKRHNVGDNGDGDRPRAREIRSMCVGDIVVMETGAFIAERFGFSRIEGPRPAGVAPINPQPETAR